MKPDWQRGDVSLYLADCRDILPAMDRAAAIVSDPPYGINYRPDYGNRRLPNGGWMRRTSAPAVRGDDVDFDPAALLQFSECLLWGANHYANKLPAGGRWLIWDKRAGIVPPRCQSCVEIAWHSIDGVDRIIHHLWDGFLKQSERGTPRQHATQKPVAVMDWCFGFIEAAAIIDPYMGSGTTGVAAAKAGRPFIGVEIDPDHFQTAVRRINAAMDEFALFDPGPPASATPDAPGLFGGE